MKRKLGRFWHADRPQVERLEERRLLAAGLVKDLNTTPASGGGTPLLEVNGTLYFAFTDEFVGNELWKTDGTAAGTSLVKDIYAGASGSSPSSLFEFHGIFYFSASSSGTGSELWRSDGTPEGTWLVKDLAPGISSSNPNGFVIINDKLLFSASPGATGLEWYTTDGTEGGTKLLIDLNPGPSHGLQFAASPAGGGYHGAPAVVFNNRLYFNGDDAVHGRELWQTDGTSEGTTLVADIIAGTGGASPDYFTAFDGSLYFTIQNGSIGGTLWRMDGAGNLAAFTDGSIASLKVALLTPTPSRLFFAAAGADNIYHLWQTTGAPGSTVPTPGAPDKPISPTSSGSRLFFVSSDASHGQELWSTDGATTTVFDIRPGVAASAPSSLIDCGSAVCFTADDGTAGRELWRATGEGASLVRDIWPGASSALSTTPAFVYGTRLWFVANDGAHGQELWVSDGTTAGTVMVGDLNPATNSSSPGNNGLRFASAGSLAYFTASGGTSPLWRSDGTPGGTINLTGPANAPLQSAQLLVGAGNKMYFSGSDSINGQELWVSDGTQAGTHMVKDINPGGAHSSPGLYMAAVGSRLFFTATTAANGYELWVTDGTEAGTHMVVDLVPGTQSGLDSFSEIVEFRGYAYFTAKSGALYFSDGTAAGTFLVKSFSSSSLVRDFLYMDGMLYFHATDGANKGLWKTDGSSFGTTFVHALANGYVWESNIFHYMIFVADGDGSGDEMWRSDGTTAGTYPLTHFSAPFAEASFGKTVEFGDGYFLVQRPTPALWKTDGTVNGTVEVKQFSSVSYDLVYAAARMFFVSGGQLWLSDGTAQGTVPVGVFRPPGSLNSTLYQANVLGTLFYNGWERSTGIELWRIGPPRANAGGNYSAPAGTLLQLDATASTDPDPNERLQYSWDLDNDGIFGETGSGALRGDEIGATPGFITKNLRPETYTVYLQVSDTVGLNAYTSARITVGLPAFMHLSADAIIAWSGTIAAPVLTLRQGGMTLDDDLSTAYSGISLGAQNSASIYLPAVQHLVSLTLSDNARLDVGAPMYLSGQPATVRGLIKSGKIFSSMVQGNTRLGIGYRFDPSANSTKVAVALLGDVNLDGNVSIADFIDLAGSFGAVNASWSQGDVNYDDQVSIGDFITLSSNFGQSYAGETSQVQPMAAAGERVAAAPLKVRPYKKRLHHPRKSLQWNPMLRRWDSGRQK